MTLGHFNRILVVLIIGLFLLANVTASENTIARDDCTSISVRTNDVTVEKGKSKQATFIVENSALEEFYVDFVEAYDYNSGIMVRADGFTRVIPGQERGYARTSIVSIGDSDLSEGQGFIEVRGHFQSARFCDVPAKEFKITVTQPGEQRISFNDAGDCGKFELNVPERYLAKGRDKVNFYAKNQLNQPVTVIVSGINTTVFTEQFTVGRNSETSLPVHFKVNSHAEEGQLQWAVSGAACIYQPKSTQLVNLLFDVQKAQAQEATAMKIVEGNAQAVSAVGANSEPAQITGQTQGRAVEENKETQAMAPIVPGVAVQNGGNGKDEPVVDPVTVALAIWNYDILAGFLMVLIIIGGIYWYRKNEKNQTNGNGLPKPQSAQAAF